MATLEKEADELGEEFGSTVRTWVVWRTHVSAWELLLNCTVAGSQV